MPRPRPLKPHVCRRRAQARKVMQHVPSYDLEGHQKVPVTAARLFVNSMKIKPPAILNVRRNSYTVDHFFWAEKGMFGLDYAEINWISFPSLQKIVDIIGSDKLFEELHDIDVTTEVERYKSEYAFV